MTEIAFKRPLLTAVARRLWRDPATLQLGVAADRAVVLAGIDERTRILLGLIDGTRDHAALLVAAELAGCSASRTEHVLRLLDGAGLLDDGSVPGLAGTDLARAERDRLAPDRAALRLVRRDAGDGSLLRRRKARLVVLGAGRVGAPLAVLLAAAGVGAIDVVDDAVVRAEDCGVGGPMPADVGRGRSEVARRLVQAAAPSVRTGPVVLPDLIIHTPCSGGEPRAAHEDVPYLAVDVRDGVGIVGPLVQPAESACLSCLDLHRTDLDPDWPTLAAQLSRGLGAVVPCDTAVAAAVAAQAALQALAFVDGTDVAAAGGTLELSPPDWRWRRRSWQLHPDCTCHWHRTG